MTEKKFSLAEVLTVATGYTLTETSPVPLIEHITGRDCHSDYDAVERFYCAQEELRTQLPWVRDVICPAPKVCEPSEAKSLSDAFIAPYAAKYGAEISVRQRTGASAEAINELPLSVRKASFPV